jgi:hypothetical protein
LSTIWFAEYSNSPLAGKRNKKSNLAILKLRPPKTKLTALSRKPSTFKRLLTIIERQEKIIGDLVEDMVDFEVKIEDSNEFGKTIWRKQ